MASTPLRARPYPLETDTPDVAADIHSLALSLDTAPAVGAGSLSSRPASAVGGNRFTVVGDSTASNNNIEWVDTGSGWIPINHISAISTTLPTSPSEGQVADLLVDATNGVVWRFRYRSASPSTHKWEFLGGGSIGTVSLSTTNINTTSWTALTTPFTLPFAGDYEIVYGCYSQNTDANFYPTLGYYFNSGSPSGAQEVRGASGTNSTLTALNIETGVAAGTTVTPAATKSASAGAFWQCVQPWIRIQPKRVG